MTKDEALRLALEALEDLGMKHYESTGEVLYKETFTAIKAALEAKDETVGTAGELFSNTALERLDLRPSTGIYITPPQRTWVGLTDEEMEAAIPFGNLSGEYSYDDILNIILLIQAKLRSKNYD
jgi:hypothetical protein